LLLPQSLVPFLEIPGDLYRVEEEVPELLVENPLQVDNRDLVPALPADPLRGVRGDVHLRAALAEGHPGEELDSRTTLALGLGRPLGEEGSALVEEFPGHDRLDVGPDPLAFGLEQPFDAIASGVVGAVKALGHRVREEPPDGRLGEGLALAVAVAGFVEEPGYPADPSVLLEKFKDALEDGSFGGIGDEAAAVFPAVPEGSLSRHRLAELGPDRDRRGDPGGDLLALPFGQSGDEGVEEAAGGARSVDRLRQGDEVGTLLPEDVGELQKLLGVSGEPGQLRENEPGDPAGSDIPKHLGGLRAAHDGLPGDGVKAVDLDHCPALHIRIHAGASFMVLRALAPDLIVGRDPDPEADAFLRLAGQRGVFPYFAMTWHGDAPGGWMFRKD
jgi:hypothetical protein